LCRERIERAAISCCSLYESYSERIASDRERIEREYREKRERKEREQRENRERTEREQREQKYPTALSIGHFCSLYKSYRERIASDRERKALYRKRTACIESRTSRDIAAAQCQVLVQEEN